MARNVNVSWVLPAVRESGKPLNPADIEAVVLSISVDGVNWSEYGRFGVDVTSTVIPELEIGEWFVEGFVLDKAGKAGKPGRASIVIPDETPPGELTLTLSFA